MELDRYLFRRGKAGRIYVRIAVPRALQARLDGQRLKVKATGTSDLRLARDEAGPFINAWRAEFRRLKADNDAIPDLPALAVGRTYGPALELLEAARRAVPDDDSAYSEHLSQRAGELQKLTRWRQDGLNASWEPIERYVREDGGARCNGTWQR